MCGRFSLGKTDRVDWVRFGVAPVPDLSPHWNISPGTNVLAVRERSGVAGEAPSREVAFLRWGLVPGWANDPSIGNRFVNARTESAHEKPAFREAFAARRCLLPADGFYEWQVVPGQKRKQPWRVEPHDHGIVALGALWERWRGRAGETLESCTILTVPASQPLSGIHERMPVIIALDDTDAWLSATTNVQTARTMCVSAAADLLDSWRISTAINAAANDGAAVAAPLPHDASA